MRWTTRRSSSTTSSRPRRRPHEEGRHPAGHAARAPRRRARPRRPRDPGRGAEARRDAHDRAPHRSRVARPPLRDDRARRVGLLEHPRVVDRDRREARAPPEARDVVGRDLADAGALQAAAGCPVPRRDAVRRGGGEVHARPGAQGRAARALGEPRRAARRRRGGRRPHGGRRHERAVRSDLGVAGAGLRGHRLADGGREGRARLQPGARRHGALQIRRVEDQHARDPRALRRLLGRQGAARPRRLQSSARGGRADDRAPDGRRGHGPLPLAGPARGAPPRPEVRRPRGDGPPRRLRRHAREAAPARRRARAVGAPPRGRPQGDPRQHPGGRGPPRARRPGARRLRLQGHEARPALSVRPRAREGAPRPGGVEPRLRRRHAEGRAAAHPHVARRARAVPEGRRDHGSRAGDAAGRRRRGEGGVARVGLGLHAVPRRPAPLPPLHARLGDEQHRRGLLPLPALPFEAAPARRLEHLALRERARRHARRAGAAQPEPGRARASLRRGSGPPGEGHGLDPDLQHQGDRRHARLRQGLRRPPGGVLPSPREGVAGSLTFALRRLLLAVPVLLGVVFIVMLTLELVPGDAVAMMLGEHATKAAVDRLREHLGLDKPLLVRYAQYVGQLARGDLGRSIIQNRPVVDELADTWPATLELTVAALLIAALVGVPAGVVSAVRPNSSFDALARLGSLFGLSMPVFWTGLVLIVLFSLWLPWLPVGGRGSLAHLVLPAVALALPSIAMLARLTRSSVLEVLHEDYVRTARAKGLQELAVVVKHGLRNALLPIVTLVGGLVLVAAAAPLLAPQDLVKQSLFEKRARPDAKHLLGADEFGRDILSRVIYGTRVALLVGTLAAAIAVVAGGALGCVAGFAGGWLDATIMRGIEILLAFPYLLLAIAIVSALGPGVVNTTIAVGVWGTPTVARMVRASVLALKETEYVRAARALGAGGPALVLRHILPNVLPTLCVYATLFMANAVLVEAALSFLGLGVQPPTPSWGLMVSTGRDVLLVAPHVATMPGLAIVVSVLGFNLLGDGLRDALDPRLRGA